MHKGGLLWQKRHSVFFHLLLALSCTAFLVHLFVGGFFGFLVGPSSRDVLHKNIENYTDVLLREIGTPPDTLKAREIARLLDLQIRYESDSLTWSTSDRLPAIRDVRGGKPPYCLGNRSPYLVRTNSDGSGFLFKGGFIESRPDMHRRRLFGLLSLLTLIFTGTYLYLRRILQPLLPLSRAAAEIGSGNLDVQLTVRRQDEVGRLTAVFNEMARSIRERIHARDQLLLDISHELRSPITRMKVALELLPDGPQKNGLLTDLAEMETMIAEILETERMNKEHGRLRLEKTNVVELIRSAVEPFTHHPPGVLVILPSREIHLSMDADRIRTVLKNVIENAVKFSKPKSKPVEISILKEGESVTIAVRDDGPGIPEEQIPLVFEPFYRVDKSRSKLPGGYGLGLSLCKKIMDAHGGGIKISNDPSGGLIVVLTFPKASGEKSPAD